MRKLLLCFCGAISLFSACKNENYKEGDGRYSYLTADFAEAHTDANKALTYMVNDAGDTLRFTQRRQLKSLNVADTAYRALVYYNRKVTGAEFINLSLIPVVAPAVDPGAVSDPLTFKSAWISKNKKYLNIGFAVKTGQGSEEKTTQRVGMVCDSVGVAPNGHRVLYLRMTHSQNGVPQYYSVRSYLSIPLQALSTGTIIHLRIRDYQRWITKNFSIER